MGKSEDLKNEFDRISDLYMSMLSEKVLLMESTLENSGLYVWDESPG